MYILLVSRSSLHLFAIKSLKLPRVIETSTYKDLQHALRRILTWMPSTRFFSMLKKCLNLRFQPVIYLGLNYKHGHFFKFNTLVSRSKTTMTLIDSNYQQQWITQVLNKALEIYNLQQHFLQSASFFLRTIWRRTQSGRCKFPWQVEKINQTSWSAVKTIKPGENYVTCIFQFSSSIT